VGDIVANGAATNAVPALSVADLRVEYHSDRGPLPALRGVDLWVERGERVGLIGESGSGKTTLVSALMGLLPSSAVVSGRLSIGDVEIDVDPTEPTAAIRWRELRGRRIAAVPQGAMSGLHPTHRVDRAVAEVMMVHRGDRSLERSEALEESRRLLADVGLDARASRAFPHELSGGMRQRVALAAALACRPDVLIADEPTVGLDVVIAARFMESLLERQQRDGFGLLIVSHDLTTVRRATDRLAVMYAGRIVESVPTASAASDALHPYSQGLFAASPSLQTQTWATIPGTAPSLLDLGHGCAFSGRCPHAHDECTTQVPQPVRFGQRTVECALYSPTNGAVPKPVVTEFPTVRERSERDALGDVVVTVRGVSKTYRSRRWFSTTETVALDGVDLEVRRGEIVGLVGVSGSGKSTLARTLFGLVRPDAGSIEVSGQQLIGSSRRRLRGARRRLALIHQDPYASLHPAMSIADLVAEPLAIAGVDRATRRRRAAEALRVVGLGDDDEFLRRRAGQLSGGQRQRVAIARAFVAEPALLVLDEPMSMLDASVRAGIASALLDIRDLLGVSAVLITHDLAEAAVICDRIVVLADGAIVEQGPTAELLGAPTHAATRSLLALVDGAVPSSAEPHPPSPNEDERV
jgi:peptide/nickel transport system ATP-binding protein